MTELDLRRYKARCIAVLLLLGDRRPLPRYIYWPWHSRVPPLYVLP